MIGRFGDRADADTDLLVIGSGPVGAVVARSVADWLPQCKITMVEAGPRHDSGSIVLRDSEFSRGVYRRYAESEWGSAAAREGLGNLPPRIMSPNHLGDEARDFEAVSIAFNVEGLGLHWRGATPWPSRGEVPSFLSMDRWETALGRAKQLLSVTDHHLAPAAQLSIRALNDIFPSSEPARAVQAMPMALARIHPRRPTRPSDIFPSLYAGGGATRSLRSSTACFELRESHDFVHAGLLDLPTAGVYPLSARAVVIAADALRTPQLLVASGYAANVGSSFSEHALVNCSFGVAPSYRDAPDSSEWNIWIPSDIGAREGLTGCVDVRFKEDECVYINIDWFVLPDQESGAMRFDLSRRDLLHLPRYQLEYSRRVSQGRIDELLKASVGISEVFGMGGSSCQTHIGRPGVSQHLTGTTPIGDSGTSVADSHGRVYGSDRVWIAGNGAIPKPLSCNSTLTAATIACHTADSVVSCLKNI
jgi:hypothetical protein